MCSRVNVVLVKKAIFSSEKLWATVKISKKDGIGKNSNNKQKTTNTL